MINFNEPAVTGYEKEYLMDTLTRGKLSGGGFYTEKCHLWFLNKLGCEKVLMTPSCTAALEMAAILIDIKPGDEVIMPSYTFVSTANAFVMRGAQIVFVDIRPDTMNINEELIEDAITPRTRAIVPVHYAGVACDMNRIMEISEKYNLFVIEDAAQGMMSAHDGRSLGVIGHFGTYSFHDTKNYTSGGEGGMLIINDKSHSLRADIVREKGTNRSQFINGLVDKYTWVELGSSYLPSELQSAYLWGQLQAVEEINTHRLNLWNLYFDLLTPLEKSGFISLPFIPDYCSHNAHMFYIKTSNIVERDNLIEFLLKESVASAFHYIPLHSSPGGALYGRFHGDDDFTTVESSRLLRLPIFYNMKVQDVDFVCKKLVEFYT